MPLRQQPTTIKILSGNKYTGNGPVSRSLVSKAPASVEDVLTDRPNTSLEVACDNEWFENDPKCVQMLTQLLQQHYQPNNGAFGQHGNGVGHIPINEPPTQLQLAQQQGAGGREEPVHPQHHQPNDGAFGQHGNGVDHILINELLTQPQELLQEHEAGGGGELGHPQHHQPGDGVDYPMDGNASIGLPPNSFIQAFGQHGNGVGHTPINEPHAALLQQMQAYNRARCFVGSD